VKITLEPTIECIDYHGVPVRLWQGSDQHGAPVVAFIAVLGVSGTHPASQKEAAQMLRELSADVAVVVRAGAKKT
jgi:hypothetical protein